MHIVIIEDDTGLGPALIAALKAEGMSSLWLRRLVDVPPLEDLHADCVLLDLSLPDGEGLSLLRRWRQRGSALPVIVLTARSALEDRLAGLDGGADDYLVKPFAMAELLSRIWAVVRRSARQADEFWRAGKLCLSPRAHQAWLDGHELELSPREFQLLCELAREPGKAVAKRALASRMDPLGDPLDNATIEVHLSNLRRKIGPARVRTIRGVGYLLETGDPE
ncbi:MAG: response regulator [Rhodocyclaceae bacterium]|nr:response regulator [Rhodocyclaceae bacterium]